MYRLAPGSHLQRQEEHERRVRRDVGGPLAPSGPAEDVETRVGAQQLRAQGEGDLARAAYLRHEQFLLPGRQRTEVLGPQGAPVPAPQPGEGPLRLLFLQVVPVDDPAERAPAQGAQHRRELHAEDLGRVAPEEGRIAPGPLSRTDASPLLVPDAPQEAPQPPEVLERGPEVAAGLLVEPAKVAGDVQSSSPPIRGSSASSASASALATAPKRASSSRSVAAWRKNALASAGGGP